MARIFDAAQLGGQPVAERVQRSPQWRDGRFHNTVPSTSAVRPGTVLRDMVRRDVPKRPSQPIPIRTPTLSADLGAGTGTGLHLTWLGHATTVVEIDGARVLIDPVWSERCSPSGVVGPKRLHAVPTSLEALAPVDAVVISHDHYDHLDMPTIQRLVALGTAPFLVPIGVGAHLRRWGVPPARIIELDWEESHTVAGIICTATPARHFSGRGLARDRTLWASWVIAGPTRKVFYTGDTGYFGGFARIGATHGPFDAALVQVGAYGEAWPDIHMTPEDGVRAHLDVGGGLLVPVHWATFVLAFHAWGEPADRVARAAKENGVPLAIPRPGERIDIAHPPEADPWWQAIA